MIEHSLKKREKEMQLVLERLENSLLQNQYFFWRQF